MAATHSVTQKKRIGKLSFWFVDNRSESITQKPMYSLTNGAISQPIQRKIQVGDQPLSVQQVQDKYTEFSAAKWRDTIWSVISDTKIHKIEGDEAKRRILAIMQSKVDNAVLVLHQTHILDPLTNKTRRSLLVSGAHIEGKVKTWKYRLRKINFDTKSKGQTRERSQSGNKRRYYWDTN